MLRLLQVITLLSSSIAASSSQAYAFNDIANSTQPATHSVAETTTPFTTSSSNDNGSSDSDDNASLHDSDDENETFGSEDSVDSTDDGSGVLSGSTISTIKPSYTNWVGPSLSSASDTACYREAHIANTCPLEYDNRHDICWAECPLAYPVKCGMECIRQNDDCALEIVSKVSVIGHSALSLATFGLYGEFKLMAHGVQIAFRCGKETMNLVKQLTKFVRTIKVSNPHTTEKYLETILYQTDNVVFDLPITICSCLGIHVSESIKTTDRITNTVELFVKEIVANTDGIVSSWASFMRFMKKVALDKPMGSLDEEGISSLQSALKSNSTCGYNMKRLLDRTWMGVANLRKQDPDISETDIRVAMSQSNLVLNEIPTMTNNCMEELVSESLGTKRRLIKHGTRCARAILDDLIRSGTSHNGTLLTAESYAYKIADKALAFYGVWDLTNVVNVVSEYFQTICGPTKFTGEIDDGGAKDALGLKTVEDAFKNSIGNWTKAGDDSITITYKSVDTEDVSVNIKSGGYKIDEVEVPAGETVTWSSNGTALGGKTLYLDRWRPGFLGLPGTGGGSLVLWVPRSTQGGSLQLTAMLNVS
ncbi:hypothetical protein PF005_g19652 [Phytophthora fragariae]|uniref:Uncharacterized protein n=1 Tax=Phytophthora fragariae TaxID=53985 RepID=A0A6A3SL23_9STRA|nr:hypothetical protein PF003_g32550 [Phytophthora fragariae]KAE8929127.1 hypothetical protein PF009_g20756 [Phytophthora fragariae]KAE9088551.1 hypothetical protein PF010_g19339 [Phytophthora fragariae]KAE9089091.1 hypothetical protein PF007_g19725 [Phytophthora fragariae]KAE9118387.1 hypothetical protein PF006_g18609 [Phytophthora fragariae]